MTDPQRVESAAPGIGSRRDTRPSTRLFGIYGSLRYRACGRGGRGSPREATPRDVSVVYGTINGLDDAHNITATESLALLNEIVRTVDKAPPQHGLEKARMLRSGYVASCRLVVPRVDHVMR